MEEKVKELLEASKRLQQESQDATAKMVAEIEKSGTTSAAQIERVDKLEAAVDSKLEAAQKRFDVMEKELAREKALGNGNPADLFAKEVAKFDMQVKNNLMSKGKIGLYKPIDAEAYSAYKPAFKAYLMGGVSGLDHNPEYRSAMSVGSDPDGGYLVPADMSGKLVGFIFDTSPLRDFAAVRTTNRDRVKGRHDLDEAGAEWVGEKSTRSRTKTPLLGVYETPIHEQHANLPVTQNELDDADEDVEGFLARKAAEKFSRAENLAFVKGNGTSRPRGFTTYADGIPKSSKFDVIERIKTGVNGQFANDPDGPDIFIDMLAALKTPYLTRAAWAMRRTVMGAARKLKDSNGQYQVLLGEDRRGRPGFLIENLPVAMFDDMDAIATGSLSIALADWMEAYEIIDRNGIRVLRDPFTAKNSGEVEIDFYKRVGGDVRNFDAIKFAQFSA